MMHVMGKKKISGVPSRGQLENELKRERGKRQRLAMAAAAVEAFVVAAAAAIVVATVLLPVMQIDGNSMSPTLKDGEIVISFKNAKITKGDIVSFYYNNKILIKRVVAMAGETVDIDGDGKVYVDNYLLEEPYLTEQALGKCDITLPCKVPEGSIFVLGDHRSMSVDSRSADIGCISEEQVVSKVTFRVWPFGGIGPVH